MEDKRTDSMQRLHSSASAAATSPPCSSSSFIPRPPSPLDLSNFASPFRHFTPSFGPDSFPAAKRPGIPPIPPSPSSSASPPFHSRSLSQPLALDSLPHIAPPPHPPPPLLLDPMLVDDRQPASRTPASRDGLPPRSAHRRSHSDVPFGLPLPSPPAPRRAPFSKQVDCSSPDVVRAGDGCKSQVAAVDDLIIAYMDSLDTLNSSGTEEKHEDLVESSRMSGTRTSGADSENESESSVNESGGDGSCGGERKEGNKRSAVGDLTPLSARHRRSFSMDSFMGKLHFADDSPKFPPSPGNQMGLLSRNGSMDETMSAFSVEFGNGEFNTAEMNKIMADEKLAEMALADPKKVKRILANRLSAARSKERKMRYISELEHKVQILQTEATTLSAQLTMLQRDSIGLTNQNNELKFRLQAMEQQAQLKDAPNFSGEDFSDEAEFTNGSVVYRCAKFQHPFQRLTSEALNEALTAEVQRLKLATGEISEAQISKSMNQQMQLNPQMLQLHQMHSQQQEKKQQTGQTSLYQLPLQKHNNVSAKLESSKC